MPKKINPTRYFGEGRMPKGDKFSGHGGYHHPPVITPVAPDKEYPGAVNPAKVGGPLTPFALPNNGPKKHGP